MLDSESATQLRGFESSRDAPPSARVVQVPNSKSQVLSNHAERTRAESSSSNPHQADLDRLRRLKEQILQGYDPNFHATPQPDTLAALSLTHNPPAHPPTNSFYAPDLVKTTARRRSPTLPATPSSLQTHTSPSSSNERILDLDHSTGASTLNGDAPSSAMANGHQPDYPSPPALAISTSKLTLREPVVKQEPIDNEALSPNSRMPPGLPHKIPARPNPGGPLGTSIPLAVPTGPRRDTRPPAPPLGPAGSRPEPVLLKRSEVQAIEKEKERLANEAAADREAKRKETLDSAIVSSPGQDRSSAPAPESESERERRKGVQHDVYIPERTPSPSIPLRRSETLTTDGRPRGVPHDIYVPPGSPPPADAAVRPKGVPHDIYVPLPSPSRDRDRDSRRPPESGRYERSDLYRPEDDRERDRRSDVADRRDYRDDDRDRRLDKYDGIRDERGRADPVRDTRVRSPPPTSRSLLERMDARDLRPAATAPRGGDSYRPRDTYDSRDVTDRDDRGRREPASYVPPPSPRRPPSPTRTVSARRDSDYRAPATYPSPNSYTPAPRDYDPPYEQRRSAWPEDDRRVPARPSEREFERDRPVPDTRRDGYDRLARATYPPPPPPPRNDPREYPPPPSSSDYYRALDASRQGYATPTTYNTSERDRDRYPEPIPAPSRIRPRSPSPVPIPPSPARPPVTNFIPPSRATHPESEVARNAKRMRLLEQQQTGGTGTGRNGTPLSSTPPTASAPAYDDRRDSRRSSSHRSSSPMRDVQYVPPSARARSPPTGPASYRESYPRERERSPARYSSWDRDDRDNRYTR